MLKDIKAAIFDLDGTLIDSMWVWRKIDIDYLKSKGFEMPADLRQCIEHLSFDETAKYFKKRFNLIDSLDKIKDDWTDMAYYEYAHNISLKPYAKEYLALLKSKGIKIALATSNSQLLLEAVLKRHNVFHFFDAVVTANEVSRGKDFPDIYILASERLNTKPENCIVFEDILPAMHSAKEAGMKVIGVYDEFSIDQGTEIKSTCDLFIEGYECILQGKENLSHTAQNM